MDIEQKPVDPLTRETLIKILVTENERIKAHDLDSSCESLPWPECFADAILAACGKLREIPTWDEWFILDEK